MAKRVADLGKAVEGLVGGRKKLVQTERKVVKALNRALGRIGYKVVAKTEPERERKRRARKKVAARRKRRGRRPRRRR
jgi:hypothetical protein